MVGRGFILLGASHLEKRRGGNQGQQAIRGLQAFEFQKDGPGSHGRKWVLLWEKVQAAHRLWIPTKLPACPGLPFGQGPVPAQRQPENQPPLFPAEAEGELGIFWLGKPQFRVAAGLEAGRAWVLVLP